MQLCRNRERSIELLQVLPAFTSTSPISTPPFCCPRATSMMRMRPSVSSAFNLNCICKDLSRGTAFIFKYLYPTIDPLVVIHHRSRRDFVVVIAGIGIIIPVHRPDIRPRVHIMGIDLFDSSGIGVPTSQPGRDALHRIEPFRRKPSELNSPREITTFPPFPFPTFTSMARHHSLACIAISTYLAMIEHVPLPSYLCRYCHAYFHRAWPKLSHCLFHHIRAHGHR